MSNTEEPLSRTDVLSNVRAYAAKVASTAHEAPSTTDIAAAEARLEQTLTELQKRIDNERSKRDIARQSATHTNIEPPHGPGGALDSVRGPASEPAVRLRQMRAVTAAYTRLAEQEPALPGPYSTLPALLALQVTAQDNSAVQRSVAETHAELRSARAQLASETAELRDNEALRDALRARVSSLREATSTAQSQPAAKTAEDTARKRLAAAQTQQRACDRDARQCTRALVRFINEQLAPLLAAEELGGPVAGSEPNIKEDDILAGFTAHGRVKKSRVRPATTTEAGDGEAATRKRQQKRQLRIDAIWGPAGGGDTDFADDEHGADRSEVEAAAEEMRELVQDLLDAGSAPGTTGPWVRLQRDSAAARFLVRANVAVLHRTDARRIRLQDFGREAED